MNRRMVRRAGLAAVVAVLVGLIAAPALATKPAPDSDLEGGHKIWICHATRSLSNPYVKILIDIAAWDIADPDSNDHGPQHHLREKDGVIWGDYALASPEDECTLDPPPPPPPPPSLFCPDGLPADYVVEFDGSKLVRHNQTQTVAAEIPAGTYDVTLISGDFDRGSDGGDPAFQPHEQWRLAGDTSTGFSDDLPDTLEDITGQVTTGLTVVFDTAVTVVTAEHWSLESGDKSNPNSVVPEFACLSVAGSGNDL